MTLDSFWPQKYNKMQSIINSLVKITTKLKKIIAFSIMFLEHTHFLTFDFYLALHPQIV